MKQDFLGAEHQHVYFLYFVISHLLASGDYGTTRGDYLMRIVLNQIPEDTSASKVVKRTFRFASFMNSERRS